MEEMGGKGILQQMIVPNDLQEHQYTLTQVQAEVKRTISIF